MNAPNSSGVLAMTTAPSMSRLFWTSGVLAAATVASRSLVTISGGVPFGTAKPYHAAAS